jgi:dienelactone hydrolase
MFSALCGVAALAAIESAHADAEIVHFPATMPDGATVTLNARIVRTADDKPAPAVVLLHGCDGSIDGTDLYSDWISRVFGGWPYLFLIVDSLGSREMSRDLDHGCGPAGPNSQMRAIDAEAARSWLASQTFVDPGRIAVIGWSAGGTAALAAIANGASHGTSGSSFAAAVAFYPTCPPRLNDQSVPLLLLVGDADHVNPWERCRDMKLEAEIPPDYQIVVYPGATHSFDRPRPRRIVFGQELFYDGTVTSDAYQRVRRFLDQYLQ